MASLNLLLDTHVALWWALDPDRLHAETLDAINSPLSTIKFSAASVWEIGIKVSIGKLEIDVDEFLDELAARDVQIISIDAHDAVHAAGLNWSHRDPFDRMLVAQAKLRDLMFTTRDSAIRDFIGSAALLA